MECEHNYFENTIEGPNGGYMIIKFCTKCFDTRGYGFIDKEHEDRYLNTLWHQGDL